MQFQISAHREHAGGQLDVDVEFSVYFKRMEESEFRVLKAIAECNDLAEVMAIVECIGMEPERLQRSFENWSSLGWFWIQK